MATSKEIANLVINKVESQAVYNYMVDNNLINDDELYFVETTGESLEDLTSHINNKNNPHEVNLAQLGITATTDELNYVDGVTSNIQEQFSALSSEIDKLKASVETWTFTLEDGSTVTKAVYVG